MCIRDRSEGMPKYQDKKGRKLTSDFSVSLKSADGFIEGESIIKSGKYDQLFEDKDFYQKSTTKMTGLVAVSYTHLDVYKRQKGKSQDVVYAISKQEYDRYFLESTVESITAYYPEFIFSYQSTNGSMKATIESYKPTIERYYNPKDIEQYKKLIAKRCEKQVFAKVPGSHFEYKDCKGQTVVHNIDIDTKTMHGTITGESNKAVSYTHLREMD